MLRKNIYGKNSFDNERMEDSLTEILCLWYESIYLNLMEDTRRKMDVQLWDSHLICSIVLSRCSTVISKILISASFNI